MSGRDRCAKSVRHSDKYFFIMTAKTLILVSELWHIDELGTAPEGTVVALDAEVEEALAVRGISYISGKGCRAPNLDFRDAAYSWAQVVLEDSANPFVEYRGVSLGRVYFYPLYLYFTRLAYWTDIVAALLDRNSCVTDIVVYPSAYRATSTTGDLAQEEINSLVDSVKLFGVKKNIAVSVPTVPPGVIHKSNVVFVI